MVRPLPVMMSTNVKPSLWARCKKPDSARCARVCVMPCRSSRASISFRPRESCERSRRPSGANGGATGATSGLGARGTLAGGCAFGAAAGFAATGVSESGAASCGFAARDRFRNGLVCFATLSHRTRSSSLRARLRRGGDDNSGIEGERFIGRGGSHDSDAGGAVHGSVWGSAVLPAAVPVSRRPPGLKLARRLPKVAPPRARRSSQAPWR